ncbi:MAG TPA: Rieske 2Fe-2S domain-containing protein [Streptosporangiaceae bacterium]|jgi:ubiquinol-cytochrome c reductase iron-sulfur subunit
MSEDDKTPAIEPEDSDDTMAHLPEAAEEEPGRPNRVIGTPSPARSLLPADSGDTLMDTPAAAAAAPEEPSGEEAASQKRTERVVAFFFILAMLAGIGFIAAYIGLPVHTLSKTGHSNLALGGCLAIVMLSMGIGFVLWVRRLMPAAETIEVRKPVASTEADRQAFQETFLEGADASGFVKRPLIRRTLIAASLPLALAPVVLLRDLGPLPGTSLRYTVWRKGMRLLVYGANTPLRPEDFATPGSLITVVPDGYQDNDDELAKAASILIKFNPGELQPPTVMKWTLQDIVCYSKICTHVGCPVALYEQTTHHILCPCHQSTFNAPKGATVVFGPAPRPLPQLPLMVDAEGYLCAAGDFDEPVGPSFWERG